MKMRELAHWLSYSWLSYNWLSYSYRLIYHKNTTVRTVNEDHHSLQNTPYLIFGESFDTI